MSDHFTVAHVAQLHEIQTVRLKRGQPGIGREVEDLIRRLTSGGVAGKSGDIRESQTKRFWDLGVGSACGSASFADYLVGIPEIPAGLLKDDAGFPLLVLVEPRIGLKKLCDLGGIAYSGDDDTFVAFDMRHSEFTGPTWIRVQDGRKNRNRSVRDCRKSFGKNERGLMALQGVCAYLLHPTVVSEATQNGARVMCLSGSAHRDFRVVAAYLDQWNGQLRLGWYWGGHAGPRGGSASRRECEAL